jgi:hypothetical protein
MNKMLLSVVFGAFLFSLTAKAEKLSEAILKCTQEKNSLKRLICFDSLSKDVKQYEDGERPDFIIPNFNLSGDTEPVTTERVRSPVALTSPVASTPPAAPSSNTAPVSAESNESDRVASLGLPKVKKRDIEKDEKIYMTVAEVERSSNKKLKLTFENGQVWRQTDTVSIKVSKGNDVYLERGSFGSFWLSKDNTKKRIRVKRER